MDRKTLLQLQENFNAFIAPLLDEQDVEDVTLSWEFQKFFHTKKLKVLTAENEQVKKWKRVLLSR
jgi:hypothetical protein